MGRGMESELIVVGMEFQMGYNYKCNEFIHSNTMRSGWRTLTTGGRGNYHSRQGEGQGPLAAGGGDKASLSATKRYPSKTTTTESIEM